MPRTETFILKTPMGKAIRDCGIPIAKLAPMFNLHTAQISRALANDEFGPTLLGRFEALGIALGLEPDQIAIRFSEDY